MNDLAKTIRIITTVGLTITIASVFGIAVNELIPWDWLTFGFTILRKTIMLLDFAIDTSTLFSILTITLNISVAYWLFLAGDWIISRLKK